MTLEDIKVPATGSDGEMEVIEISIAVGDQIEMDDTIVVLESDKATVEVPAPKSGKVSALSVKVGDKVKEGDGLIQLNIEDEGAEELAQKKGAETEGSDSQKSSSDNDSKHLKESKNDRAADVLKQQVVVPDLGGSDSVEVIEVSAAAGDRLAEDETLLVLESDKATMEIPCPVAGKLLEIHIKVGDKVSAGDLIAELEVEQTDNEQTGSVDTSTKTPTPTEEKPRTPVKEPAAASTTHTKEVANTHKSTSVHAGPAVRKFAREHGVDLPSVKASGPRDRILIDDVSAYIKSQVQKAQSGGLSSAGMSGVETVPLPDFSQFGDISASSMSKVHIKTAENMQRSWSLPHVTQFDEADITEMEAFRKQQKSVAEQKGVKLTPIAFLLKASAHALSVLPQFNVSLDLAHQKVIQKHYIHIGFAVDTPHGLFVPVVRDVNKKGIWQIASECQDLAKRAKDKKLMPNEMQGGCFTISSLGAIGGTAFTPIVNAPEVAILGLSASKMKPVYDENKGFVPRLMLPMSLSYDHRAVNGADAARFTHLLSRVLGDLRELLL
ncbi:MAG: dihydrolipoyllysine-residue acetyltransferase [Oleiphilus sp.]